MRIVTLCIFSFFLFIVSTTYSGNSLIKTVSLSQQNFNPILSGELQIRIQLSTSGNLSAYILDRDGYLVRTLSKEEPIKTGNKILSWNGRDERNEFVPNEAYNLKLDFISTDGRTESYFPAAISAKLTAIRANYYDRQSGILSYELPTPSRVHIQAGSATVDAKTGIVSGPVLRTIVNREPRSAGRIVEYWDGFGELGSSIYVPDLKNFAIAIAASPLPENSIIIYGNSSRTFLEYAATRQGVTLFANRNNKHHEGLNALEDVSPAIELKITNAEWSSRNRSWVVNVNDLVLEGSLQGISSPYFSKQPGKLLVFINEEKIQTLASPGPATTFRIKVPIRTKSSRRQILAVNWASEFGPTAVGVLVFDSSAVVKKVSQ